MQLTQSEYYAFLRKDLYTFAIRCFAELNPGTTSIPGWHLMLIAAVLTDCLAGKTPKVVINFSNRYLK